MTKYNLITLIITMLMVAGCSLNNFADPTVGTVTDGEIDPSIFIPGTITYHPNGKIKSGTLYGVQTLTHGAKFGHPDNTGTGRIMFNVQGGTITNALTDADVEIITNDDVTIERNIVTNENSIFSNIITNGITNVVTYTNVDVITNVIFVTNIEIYTNIFARDGSYVTFHDNGVVKTGDLYGTNGINGLMWWSHVVLHTNGIVKQGIAAGHNPGLNGQPLRDPIHMIVSNARGPFLIHTGTFLTFYENGYVKSCQLPNISWVNLDPNAPNDGVFTNNRFNDGATGHLAAGRALSFNRDGSLFKERQLFNRRDIWVYATNDYDY